MFKPAYGSFFSVRIPIKIVKYFTPMWLWAVFLLKCRGNGSNFEEIVRCF